MLDVVEKELKRAGLDYTRIPRSAGGSPEMIQTESGAIIYMHNPMTIALQEHGGKNYGYSPDKVHELVQDLQS